MTTMLFILYLAMASSTISLSEGLVLIPPHPNLLHHMHPAFSALRPTQKLAIIASHIGLNYLSKGSHAKIPISSRIPLTALTLRAKLIPHVVHSKLLTSPISSVTRASPLTIRSADPKLITDQKIPLDPTNKLTDNEDKLDVISSTAFSNTSRRDEIHSPKIRSSDNYGSIEELDYLTKAANPTDVTESNFRPLIKGTEEGFEYRMQKMNRTALSGPYQDTTKTYEDQEIPIPYQIWTQNSANNNYKGQSKISSLNNKMNDYLKVLNISRNFKNPSYESQDKNQTRGLRNIIDDFQKSLSRSLLFQNGMSAFQKNSSNENMNNYNGFPNDQSKNQQSANPADKIWNSASNFAGNVAERAFDLADNFVAAVMNPENIRNNRFFKPNNENGYQPEYRQDHRTPSSQQIGFSNQAAGITDRNIEMNPGYNDNHQFNPYRPFYNGGYYPTNGPKAVWNSAADLGQNIGHTDGGGYYYKRSNPIELLSNPATQYSIARNYRQMSPTNNGVLHLLGQTPLTNYETINSGSEIVNSALNLAQGIVGGNYDKVVHSSVNMGTDITKAASGYQVGTPQLFKRSSIHENISNFPTTAADNRANAALNTKIDEVIPYKTPSINTLSINSSNIENDKFLSPIDSVEYNKKSRPVQPSWKMEPAIMLANENVNTGINVENGRNDHTLESINHLNTNQNLAFDTAGKTDNFAINFGPYGTRQTWNPAVPLKSGAVNPAIYPTVVEMRRVLRSPYEGGSYSDILPLRTIYDPTAAVDDVSTIAVNPTHFGTTYLY